jgi:tetratricopeptide (TPR) repeat protein
MNHRVNRLSLLVVVLFLTALVPIRSSAAGKIPVTTDSPEAREQFLKGQLLVDNLRLTDASPYFAKAVAADPDFALAYLYVALTAPTTKEFFAGLDRAVSLASHASKGEQLWIAGTRAGAYGDGAGQLAAYRELADAFPDDERAQTLFGVVYFGRQEYSEGAKYLRKATEINPDFAPAYNQLGYAYMFTGNLTAAEQAFKRYTELLPHDPNPFDSYAEFLLSSGRFKESIVQYRKALEINPHFINSSMGIAAALMYQNDHEKARAEVRRVLSEARNDGEKRFAHFVLSVISADQGRTDDAVAQLQTEYGIAEKGGDGVSMGADLMAMGNVLANAGRADEARVKYEESLAAVEASAAAEEVKENARRAHHFNLAWAALARHDLETARKEADVFRAGVEEKSNPFQKRRVHELAGTIALEEKKFPSAVDELKLANQRDATVLYRLALAYQGLGKLEQAKEVCSRAAHFNPLPAYHFAFARKKAATLLAQLNEGGASGTR